MPQKDRERERIIGINTQGRKEEKKRGGTRREGKEEKENKQKSKTGQASYLPKNAVVYSLLCMQEEGQNSVKLSKPKDDLFGKRYVQDAQQG